jgi:exosome complex component CSL4
MSEMGNRLVLPGDHLSSAEEAEPGQNTYSERDEIFSATMGEDTSVSGLAAVKSRGRNLPLPAVGMEVYGVVVKASPNKAVAGCIPVSEAEGQGRGVEIFAVLPVTAVRRGYVNDLRDEVKIGDILRARIKSIDRTGVEISMLQQECGIVACFCPRDRRRMDLHDTIFICPQCGWKERRKIPGAEDESRDSGGGGFRREGGFRDRGPPRGGFRPREGGRGFRPREGGYRPREGGQGSRPPRKRYEYGR